MLTRSAVILASVVLLSVGIADRRADAHGKNHNPVRYDFVMKNGIPATYLGLTNPLTPNSGDIAQGSKLYAEHCAACHGPTGNGDGPDAKDLKPRPPSLSGMMKMIANMKHGAEMMKAQAQQTSKSREMSMMTEGYLYWTISEGGEAMESPMPGFKEAISEKERWQLILFMSNDFKSKIAQ